MPWDGLPDSLVTAQAQRAGLSYDQIIDVYLKGYGKRPALAERVYTLQIDPATGAKHRSYLPAYRAISYRTLRERVHALAMAWRHDPEFSILPGEFVGVIGFASIDYAVIDLALAYAKAVSVPLSGHHTPAEFEDIFARVLPAALVVSIAQLPAVADWVIRLDSIRSLIVIDYDTEVTSEWSILEIAESKLRAAGCLIPVLPVHSLIRRGNHANYQFLPTSEDDPDKTALLIHTSGSTGEPKGACIPAKALINTWRNVSGPYPKIVVVLAPFHHMMGRDSMVSALNAGGTAFFTQKADLSTVFEDIQLVRPTVLVLFPRICEWIYQHAQTVPSKNRSGDPAEERAADTSPSFLGDRLEFIVVASAPIAPHIKRFLEDRLQVPVHEGYSSTETASGGLAMNGVLNRNTITEFRLRDVPELGYFATDLPHPRGELCVKTRYGIKQYFKNPEATAELFDGEGYCCTGDIVELQGSNQIRIIDRRKNAIKLSQGEYVAVGKLGQVFEEGCSCAQQVYVHGDSKRSYLLAVVVPDQNALARMVQPPESQVELIAFLRNEFLRVAGDQGLRSFEIPRDLIIAEEPFSQENGLLSSLGKPIRAAIKEHYLGALEQLYESHEGTQRATQKRLRHATTTLNTEDKLLVLLNGTLGVNSDQQAQSLSFRELGGDSLGAVQLSVLIEKEFGVLIEGSQILGPRGTIQEWARMIRAAQDSGVRHAQRERQVGALTNSELYANDFRLEKHVEENLVRAVKGLAPGSRPPQTVLLTGASGFLGGRVCIAWLKRLTAIGGRIICLVRPSTSQSAQERLEARFAHFDQEAAANYKTMADRHLEVVAADITEHRFGLDNATYERLAQEVDVICHCAALVNHRLAYHHVYRPNVVGTAEIIRLAMTQKRKPIDFVSTIGIGSLTNQSTLPTDTKSKPASIRLDESYANGYFASKWACEQLLLSTHEETGLPVRVVRPGLILPDRQLAGEMNQDDILSRLIYSLLTTGMAPERFTFQSPDGHEKGFCPTGLPIDQLAEAIVALGDFAPDGFHTLNLGSAAANAFPLDALVDCLEAQGFAVQRFPNHRQWLNRLTQELRKLPAKERAPSLYDVLEAYSPSSSAEHCHPESIAFQHFLEERFGENQRTTFSDAYLRKYLTDFATRGLIAPLPTPNN